MSFRVVILESARQDLKELREYVAGKFSHATWLDTSAQLKAAIARLKESPRAGGIPAEIEMLNLDEYRQFISGMNRIIYEVRGDMVFVYAVVDVRRDMVSLLTKRLLRPLR